MSIGKIGKYERLDILGHGASGIVYLAWDTLLRRRVALKEIRAAGPEADRVLDEARVLDRLRHPNIIEVHSVDVAESAILIDMELVPGQNLAEILKERRSAPLPLEQAIYVVSGVLEALAYAHERRVVHRDIKPANILIGTQGEVKLTDFGLAEALGSGSIVGGGGTYPYMAPEDFSESPETDYRSDLWSVGVVLYELLAGKRPFVATDTRNPFSWQQAVTEGTPTPLGSAPLDELLTRALHKDKSQRFSSARAFADALRRLVPEPRPLLATAPGAASSAPTTSAADAPPRFAFPDGRVAEDLDGLLDGAARNWDTSRAALADGRFEAFLIRVGEPFIAALARDLAEQDDLSPDRRLREFLERAQGEAPPLEEKTVATPLKEKLAAVLPSRLPTTSESPPGPTELEPPPPPALVPKMRWWFPLVLAFSGGPPTLAFLRQPAAGLFAETSGFLSGLALTGALGAMLWQVVLGSNQSALARNLCLLPMGIGVTAGGALAALRLGASPTPQALMPVAAATLLPLGVLLIQAVSARPFWRGWLAVLLLANLLACAYFALPGA
jgi:hypothetical protein